MTSRSQGSGANHLSLMCACVLLWRIETQACIDRLMLLFLRDEATPQVSQTGDTQKRGEVGNLASVLQDFIVQCADEGVGGAALILGHFGQHIPHGVFQANAGEHAANANRAGTLLVQNRIGFDEILTHALLLGRTC